MRGSAPASLLPPPCAVRRSATFSRHFSSGRFAVVLAAIIGFALSPIAAPQTKQKTKLPRTRILDRGIVWQRDPETGELRVASSGSGHSTSDSPKPEGSAIQVVTQMVAVTCSVATAEGEAAPGLRAADFRIFDNGIAQKIAYFAASNQPASVGMVIDASPSVLRDSEEMKRAANALAGALAPLDQAAVLDFSAHTYLLLPFSDVRELIRRAVARVDPRALLGDTGGSHIYEAVYLTARDLFSGRQGRKSIVLLTDGQDSGLGLTLDPASTVPQPGDPRARLTFDDVAKLLAERDIQIFAVSTEPRPKGMTPEWLADHANETLVSSSASKLEIPPYTLFLAELVRRAGGQLYFLHETPTMADTFREIASKIRAEYTLGYYPPQDVSAPRASANEAGWHQLHVEVPAQNDAHVSYRASYYVPPQK